MLENSIIWTDIKTHSPGIDCPRKYGCGKEINFISWLCDDLWFVDNADTGRVIGEFPSFEEMEKKCLEIISNDR